MYAPDKKNSALVPRDKTAMGRGGGGALRGRREEAIRSMLSGPTSFIPHRLEGHRGAATESWTSHIRGTVGPRRDPLLQRQQEAVHALHVCKIEQLLPITRMTRFFFGAPAS